MPEVVMRPMAQDEYDAWVPGAIESYAADHERNGSRPAGQALDMAKEEFAKLLPNGLDTAEHHLLVGTVDDNRVGRLWLHIPVATDASVTAFVYDVEVDADERGKGFGRGLMLAAEGFARQHNANVMKLHVFGDNKVALRLYERLGYEPTNVNMAKRLDA